MIRLTCSGCDKTFQSKPDLARRHINCPHCGHVNLMPAATGATPALAPAERATLPPAAPAAETATLPPAPEAATVPPLAAFTDAPPATLPQGGADAVAAAGSPDGYEILSELGRGGMGVVYKARQTALRRTVALKMILGGGHAGAADLERFRTEAESIARLQHPNIVQIHEVGDHGGLPFFSLEFCAGGSLEKKLGGTPLPPLQAAALVEKLARAMQAAHDKGVIHRDLKPANVLLAEDGTPKVTDFGLAKKLDEAGKTQAGSIMGTPSYMAPEQAGGKSKELGPACDVYALGALLYECLTGRPPFRAATPLDTVLQVVSDEPVPPTQLNGQLPRDLETICLKCLQKEPARRYGSADALADDLQRFQRGEAIQARPVGRLERAAKWVRRNPAVSALAATVVLVLLTGVAVASYFAVAASHEAERANLKSQEAEANAEQAKKEARRADDKSALAATEAKAARKAEAEALVREQEAKFEAYRANIARHAIQIDLALRAWQERDLLRARQILAEVTPQFKQNWETRHLVGLCQRTARTLKGHTQAVTSVSFSPDGKSIVSGSSDRTLKLWDAHTGQHKLTLKGHTQGVSSVCFSPDGKRIVSGSVDKTVKVWDAQTGQDKLTLEGHTGHVNSVSFSPDGNSIVSGGTGLQKIGENFVAGAEIKVWDAQTGQHKLTLKGHTNVVTSVSFSPDSKSIVSGSWDNTLKVWDAETGQHKRTLKGHTNKGVRSVSFSRDGNNIVSGSSDETLKVWDAHTGQHKLTLTGHTGSVTSVSFSPDGNSIVSGSGHPDNTLKVWDAQTGQHKLTLKGHTGSVTSVCFSPDGKSIVSGSGDQDKTLKVWDAQIGQDKLTLKGHTGFVLSVSFSPDGNSIVSGGGWFNKPGEIKVWDAQSGQEKLTLKGHNSAVNTVSFSRDGNSIVSGAGAFNKPGEIKVWNAHTGQHKLTLTRHTAVVSSVSFSPDGNSIVSGSSDKTLMVWEAQTGQHKLTLKGHTQGVSSVCFSPDGNSIVSGSSDKTLKVWDAQTGQHKRTLTGHTAVVSSVRFSRDGNSIVSGSGDKTLMVWDAQTGQHKLTLKGHTQGVSSVCFSPDGKSIVSGSVGEDSTLKLWDAQTGQEILTLKGHKAGGPSNFGGTWANINGVSSVRFSRDGNSIVSGGLDKTLKVWDAP